jgi:hypothetical protein
LAFSNSRATVKGMKRRRPSIQDVQRRRTEESEHGRRLLSTLLRSVGPLFEPPTWDNPGITQLTQVC